MRLVWRTPNPDCTRWEPTPLTARTKSLPSHPAQDLPVKKHKNPDVPRFLLGPQGQLFVHQTRRFTLLTMAMTLFDVCISNRLFQLKLNYFCKHWGSARIRLSMLQFLPSSLLSQLPGFILVQLLLEVQTKIYLKYLKSLPRANS